MINKIGPVGDCYVFKVLKLQFVNNREYRFVTYFERNISRFSADFETPFEFHPTQKLSEGSHLTSLTDAPEGEAANKFAWDIDF